jgi:hypothetical protein
VNLTNANILTAIDKCAQINMPKPWYGFLHPQQLSDLYAESSSVYLDAAKSAQVAANTYGEYFIGRVYGVDWWVSTNVPSANAGADRAGAILSGEAIGAVISKMPQTVTDHDQSLRGDEVLTVMEYGVGEIDGTMGMYIISDL